MKTTRNLKFSFEKYEIAKFKKTRIKGGDTTNTNGDPDTGTKTSENCSTKPGCKNGDPSVDPDPLDPGTDVFKGI